MKVGVIVNAVNESLLGGGGVDGAMYRAVSDRTVERRSRKKDKGEREERAKNCRAPTSAKATLNFSSISYLGGEKCATPHLTEDALKEYTRQALSFLIENREALIEDGRLVKAALTNHTEIDAELQVVTFSAAASRRQ